MFDEIHVDNRRNHTEDNYENVMHLGCSSWECIEHEYKVMPETEYEHKYVINGNEVDENTMAQFVNNVKASGEKMYVYRW